MKQKWTKAGVQIKHFIIFRTARSFLVPQSKRTNTKTCCITPLSLCVVCLFVWLFAVSLVWMFNGGGSGMLKSHTHLALIGLTKTNAPYKTNIPQRKCFKIILSIEHSNAKALMDRFQQPALFRGFLNTDLTVCSSSRALKRSAWAVRSEASFPLVTTRNDPSNNVRATEVIQRHVYGSANARTNAKMWWEQFDWRFKAELEPYLASLECSASSANGHAQWVP